MKRAIFWMTLAVPFFVYVAACNRGPTPREVVAQYLESYYHGNYNEAYEVLCSGDKAVKKPQDYVNDARDFFGVIQAVSRKVTFSIKEVTTTGDRAVAFVEVTSPELSGAMKEYLAQTLSSAVTGGRADEKSIERVIAQKMKDKDVPIVTSREQFDLVREKGVWRICMGWEAQKKAAQQKVEAEKLEGEKRYAEARALLFHAQMLVPRDEDISKRIKDLDEKMLRQKERLDYFAKVELAKVTIWRSTAGEEVVGEVRNRGKRVLKQVEITAYCLDREGNVIFEKSYRPVLVSESYFDPRDNQPLKPNQSRPFTCKLNDAPSNWSGKVRVSVTDLEFSGT